MLVFRASEQAEFILYKSIVWSTLIYASVIPIADNGDLRLLEWVQRQAGKCILDDYISNLWL